MPPQSNPPQPDFDHFQSNKTWTNKHGNVTAKPKRLYDVWNRWLPPEPPMAKRWESGLACLQAIVTTAEKLNSSVRGLGGGWSLSQAAVTTGFMTNTNPLNVMEIGFRAENCDPSLAHPERLVFAQCGISVLELNNELEKRGFSLPTSGASNGQTIAGAISTGTHGSAVQVGSMQDFILGFHLVSEEGLHHWIERKSRPCVSQRFCEIIGARLVRDDRLFNAAVVSFGSFGIIHAVVFQAEPIYLLQTYTKRFDYPDVKNVLPTLDVTPLNLEGGSGSDLPFHFQVVVNPYAAEAGGRGAYVRWMFKRPFAPVPAPVNTPATIAPGDDILSVIAGLTDLAAPLIPPAVGTLLNREYKEDLTGTKATHGGTFGATDMTAGGSSCELGLSLSNTPAAVDAILDVAKKNPFAGVIALRFVKASSASLAFTRFAPITCTIELPAVNSTRTRKAFELIWDELETRNIVHTFHWGQCMRPSFARLQQAFGNRLDDWLAARRGFLSEKGRRTFSNKMLKQWELDE